MAQADEDILARVRASGNAKLSAAEVATLTAEGGQSLLAHRLLSMHFYNAGAYERALEHARAVFSAVPDGEAAKNLLALLNRSGKHEEALALCDRSGDLLDPIHLAEAQCTTSVMLGRLDDAVRHGTRALSLKDSASPSVSQPDPVVRRFDPRRPERNIISFSLFGAQRRYCEGALRNAQVARHLYPGWTPRFYIDESVPETVVQKLLQEGAQVRKAPNLPAARYGLFWRMLVEDDPDVDHYLVRDCDSVLNIKERVAVEAWLESGQPFHVMRDHPIHCELILAGMWGAHRGNIGEMGKRILAYVNAAQNRLNDRTVDQIFLRQVVWPLTRRRAVVHDSWFSFGDAAPYPPGFALVWPDHIGRNLF